MKRVIIGVIFPLLLFAQSIVAQNNSRRVVATHIKTENLSYEEQDLLRDINTYLHSAFENNGYALASLDEEDRETSNKLELLNFIDANVRGINGEAVDYVVILWGEQINGEYKVYSKKIGRSNTDYKLGTPIVKCNVLIKKQPVRELVALAVAKQYIVFSSSNQLAFEARCREENDIIMAIKKENKISFHPDSYFNMRVLSGFTNKDIIGFGFHGNKSFFQIGADFVLSKVFSYKNQIDDGWGNGFRESSDKSRTEPGWYYGDILKNIATLEANYYKLEQTEEQRKKGEQDYIRPQFQFAISPGINLKYVSIECGLGLVVSQSVKVKRVNYDGYSGYHQGVDEWPKSQTNLLIRPTIVGYLPVGRDGNGGVSISVGYNIVDKLDIYNGFIASLGFIVKL